MKTFKVLRLIFQVLATAAFLVSILICGIDLSASNTAFWGTVTAYGAVVVLSVVGMLLVSAPSDMARRVGHGLIVPSFTLGLTAALMFIEDSSASIVMLVAAILLAIYYLWVLVVKIMQKNTSDAESPNEDIRIVHVKQWKQIMEEGVISPEEYEAKRCQLLGLKPKKDPKEEK